MRTVSLQGAFQHVAASQLGTNVVPRPRTLSRMVCLAAPAPAATAADATGFALVKRYLVGREPALWHPFPTPLFDFPPPAARYTTPAPVYDLTAAVGFWGPESQPEEIGWTEVPGVSLKDGMFVARVTGTSMEPLIPDGSWCLFRPCPVGSPEGRIVLVELATDGAGENGGRFTVKKYHSKLSTDLAVTTDGWRHRRIQLLPLNPALEPIEIDAEVAADIVIIGEFLKIALKK